MEKDRYHVTALCMGLFCEACTDARWCLCKCHRQEARQTTKSGTSTPAARPMQ